MVSDSSYMWFGIPGKSMQWVPAPQSGFQRNWTGYKQQLALLDGRQIVRTSSQKYSSFEGNFFGDYRDLANIDVFNKFASGFYGGGPIVFADPFAAQQNVFAPHWASPALVGQGWAPLTASLQLAPATFGSLATGPTYGRPDRWANFAIQTGVYGSSGPGTQYNHYIAIPPDSKLYLGATALATGSAKVYVQTYNRSNQPSSITPLSLIDPASSTQMTDVFDGATFSAVRVFLSRSDLSDSTLTLFSMMGQIWPSNITPSTTGMHIAGQGHLGLRISGDAIAETYNYGGVKKGLSLTLEESL